MEDPMPASAYLLPLATFVVLVLAYGAHTALQGLALTLMASALVAVVMCVPVLLIKETRLSVPDLGEPSCHVV